MPLAGGSSDKIGNRYEGRWTAKAMLEVLREDAQAIRLEPPGADGAGVEFYLRYHDRIEFHQVKRQRTGKGDWSISALTQAGVLTTFRDRLKDPAAHCRFISAHSAGALVELSTHARSATSWQEYERDFLVAKPLRKEYAHLKQAWEMSDDEVVLAFLRRVHVSTLDETTLQRWTMTEASGIVDGDQPKLLPTLVDIALDNVNRFLAPDELWKLLSKYDYKPSFWATPQQVALLVAAANQRYIESRKATLINGEAITRSETASLEAAASTNRLVLLDGVAGTGKSDVVLQFLDRLESTGTPYLALRLDRSSPTRRKEDLGHELGLPSSPCTTLTALAQGRTAYLVIDQLDAVSAISGRSPQFIECVADIVHSAHAIPNLRIVLVCRTFDVENDARLRQLIALGGERKTVTVGPLELEQLSAPLLRLGHPDGTLSQRQLEILRVPLHLALFAGLPANGERNLSFSTSLDLHNAFWECKRRELDTRLGTSSWVQATEKIVDYMSRHQVLRAPRAIVDEWAPYVDGMVSAHVLIRDGQQLAFFHESFFDYSFARIFIGGQKTIASLLSQDQLLFRRGQVRQILAHERSSPGNEYRRDLAYILQDQSVRFHIKDVVITGLSQVSPRQEEWALLEPLLLDPSSPLLGAAWRTLSSAEWFRYADARGFVEARLRAEDSLTVRMESILAFAGKSMRDRVAELLSPFIDLPAWQERIGSIVSQAGIGESRPLFELFLGWLDKCFMGQRLGLAQSSGAFSIAINELEKSKPDWCCEAIGRLLTLSSAAALSAGCNNPFDLGANTLPSTLHIEMTIGEISTKAPDAFMAEIWPAMLDIIERNTEVDENILTADQIWGYRHDSEHVDLANSLLHGAASAFRHTAKSNRSRFQELLNAHRRTDSETVVYLLYEGMRAAPEQFSDAAVDYALGDRRRLRIGYSNSPWWSTRRLLEAITPFCCDDNITRLEQVLLELYPERYGQPGRAQYALLGGIALPRQSSKVRARLGEFSRKFDNDGKPEGVVVGWVESPIPEQSASKMNDEQWLRAIEKYGTGRHELGRTRELLKGGAEELSRVLKSETERHPLRFARLGVQLPDTTHSAYFDALLLGLTDAEQQPPLDAVKPLLEKCHQLRDRPCGRWIGGPLTKCAETRIPDDLLAIVEWYAINDPDPLIDHPPRERPQGDLGLLNHGINTVRGAIASNIAAIVRAHPDHSSCLRDAIQSLASDSVTAVRAVAGEVVCALVPTAPATAQSLFLRLIDDPDDRLLITRSVHLYFLWHAADDFAVLRPVMERMLKSDISDVRKFGAAYFNLAALTNPEARASADACLSSGDDFLRLGAAMVFKTNLATPEHAPRCTEMLKRLFNDTSAEVRKMAGSAIWRLEGTELGDNVDLANYFLESDAFEANADDLVHALKETTAAVPELVLKTCERTLDAFEAQRRGPLMYQAKDALTLVLRAYADGEERSFKDRALDLVDRALRIDIFGMNRLLAEHDRWWETL